MTTQTIRKILTRDFILCSFAQFVFGIANTILIPTLPIYLSRLGSKEAEIGVLIGIFAISSLVLRPFVGRALLKIPEKKFMIAGALLCAFTSIAYFLTSSFWPFLIIRVFHGIGWALFQTASFTLIANISIEPHRGQSFSYFFLANNISLALGPSFGMFLINHFSFALLFSVCLSLSLCALLVTKKLRGKQVGHMKDSSMSYGFFFHRKVIPPSTMNFLFSFKWGAVTAFFPLYAINHGVVNPGLFFSTVAMMLILGRTLGGRILDLYSREKVITPCLFIPIIAMVILAFSNTSPMFILVAVIWGIGHAFLTPALTVQALDRLGSSSGIAMGMITASLDLGMSLGPLIMGIVIYSTSYPIMFLCLALIGIINLSYFYFFVRITG